MRFTHPVGTEKIIRESASGILPGRSCFVEVFVLHLKLTIFFVVDNERNTKLFHVAEKQYFYSFRL